jgi:ankyrin repeat protein
VDVGGSHLNTLQVDRQRIPQVRNAPLDHVNNLGWTALIESITLGDGGPRHIAKLSSLVDGGANVNLADPSGSSPLALAGQRGYNGMVVILEKAGAR